MGAVKGLNTVLGRAYDKALDMSQEARTGRARDMGFDVESPVYHATSADIEAFNPSNRGKMGPGVYVADTPSYAQRYIGGASGPYDQGSSVMPLVTRGDMAPADVIDTVSSEQMKRVASGEVSMAEAKRATNQILQDMGYAGRHVSEERVIFDPANIRSVNAAFDPDKKDSANLLAGGAAAAVGLGAATQGEDAEAGAGGVLKAAGKSVYNNVQNLQRLGFLSPEVASNPRAVSAAQTRYDNALRTSPAFRREESARQGRDIETTGEGVTERNVISPEDLQGSTLVPVQGDRSRTGFDITNYAGRDLPEPVPVQGGPQFSAQYQDEGIGWASMASAARPKQNAIRRAAEAGSGDVVGVYNAMGREGINFSTPIAQAMVQRAQISTIPKKDRAAFDRAVRKLRPEWVGLDDPKAMDQLLAKGDFENKPAGDIRKAVVEEMSKSSWRNKGFPPYGELVEELIEPALRNADVGDSGFSMFRGDPDADVAPFDRHLSYNTAIPGEYIGGLLDSVPPEVMFPKSMAAMSQRNSVAGKPLTRQQQVGAINRRGDIAEPADQQWLDNIMEYARKNQRGSAPPEAMAGTAGVAAAGTAAAGDPSFTDTAKQYAGGVMDALEMPWRGYLGATRMAGGLLAGEDVDSAVDQAVRQIKQPVEETADELGGAATDATGSPEAGTLAYLMSLLGGPI